MPQPVLAQYTIRSKQGYIFRSNRLVEIVGASALIRDAFDLLLAQAAGAGLHTQPLPQHGDGSFCWQQVQAAFAAGSLNMIELFRGGGNDTVLFDSPESCRTANRAFTYAVLKACPGMVPLCVSCPATGDYKRDYASLMLAAEQAKSAMYPGRDTYALPFAMMDRTTYQPLAAVVNSQGAPARLSAESYAKRCAGKKDDKTQADTRLLDTMVTEHGQESLLAVVHADGNNMGKKIAASLGDCTDYDYAVNFMRGFTSGTAAAFVDAGCAALQATRAALQKGDPHHPNRYAYRLIVTDGDDVTFVCNARAAMAYTRAYLQAVQAAGGGGYSSCAGVCIFHSHYPFARAYALAEQACDNAKQYVHQTGNEEAWLDYHYIHSGIGGELEALRQRQHTAPCMARPWCVAGCSADNPRALSRLDALAAAWADAFGGSPDAARTAIKAVGAAWESSAEEGYAELERVYYRRPGLERALRGLFPKTEGQGGDPLLRAIYDLYEIYDLWYTAGEVQ